MLEDIRRNARWAKVAERDHTQMLINAKQFQQRQDTERKKQEFTRTMMDALFFPADDPQEAKPIAIIA